VIANLKAHCQFDQIANRQSEIGNAHVIQKHDFSINHSKV